MDDHNKSNNDCNYQTRNTLILCMTPFLITAFLSQRFDYLNNYLDQSGYLRVFYWTIMPILQIRRGRLGETKCLVLGHTAKRSWYWKPG